MSSNTHSAGAAAPHRDDFGAKMGMWLFLFTELLLFGGLFVVYMVYRIEYSEAFHFAGSQLSVGLGTFNTIVLLTSSLTVVLAIVAIQKGNKLLSIFYLIATQILALVFMIVKAIEWGGKISKDIFPGSETVANMENGEIMFFGLYYSMTGLHALHVLIGMVILGFNLVFIIRNKVTQDNYVKLENGGLYWHLVDLIWIFLFPLFYLLH